jgi:hypothetical protein
MALMITPLDEDAPRVEPAPLSSNRELGPLPDRWRVLHPDT